MVEAPFVLSGKGSVGWGQSEMSDNRATDELPQKDWEKNVEVLVHIKDVPRVKRMAEHEFGQGPKGGQRGGGREVEGAGNPNQRLGEVSIVGFEISGSDMSQVYLHTLCRKALEDLKQTAFLAPESIVGAVFKGENVQVRQ